MKNVLKYALIGGLALSGAAAVAHAETVTTTRTQTTTERQMTTDNSHIDLARLERDNNGTIVLDDLARHLFYLYDTDGNELIDNQEFEARRIATIMPVERETITVVDTISSNGEPELMTHNYTHFMERTGLSRFETNADGLTAHEFLGDVSFLEADQNSDHGIGLEEWKAAYSADYQKPHDEGDAYN